MTVWESYCHALEKGCLSERRAWSDSTTTGISPVYCRIESRMSQNVTVGRLHQRRIGQALKSIFLFHSAFLMMFLFEYFTYCITSPMFFSAISPLANPLHQWWESWSQSNSHLELCRFRLLGIKNRFFFGHFWPFELWNKKDNLL